MIDIVKLTEQARDEDLMMSRMNCHGEGLHSIVIKNDCGRLTRFFITDSNHMMHTNLNDAFNIHLGVHNHRYPIRLTGVFGQSININYKEDAHKSDVAKYTFNSLIRGGDGAIFNKFSGLTIDTVNVISDIFLKREVLHTIYVPKREIACWIVTEGIEVTTVVDLFQNGNVSAPTYDKFSNPIEVRSLVKRLVKKSKRQ